MKKYIFAIFFIIPLSIFLSACESSQDSDQAKKYQSVVDLDSKNYDAVITNLGDCSQFFAEDRQECLLNLASANMGKGGINLLTMGYDIIELSHNKASDKQYQNDLRALLMRKMDNDFVRRGVVVIDQLLAEADPILKNRLCTQDRYKNHGHYIIQGCLSSNPFLLEEILTDSVASSSQSKSSALSLSDVVNYQSTIQAAAPEAEIDDIIAIVNKEKPISSKDKNANDILDDLDATSCVLDAYKSGKFNAGDCTSPYTQVSQLSENAFSGSTNALTNALLKNVYSIATTVSNQAGSTSNVFYRIAQQVVNSTHIITLSTKGYCEIDGETSCPASSVDGVSCLPCAVVSEGATRTQNLGDLADKFLNDSSSFKALASMIEVIDDSKTDDQKAHLLLEKICGTGLSKCPDRNPDGSPYIPINVAIDYFKLN